VVAEQRPEDVHLAVQAVVDNQVVRHAHAVRLPRRGERREEVATRRTRTARAAARRGEGENGARAKTRHWRITHLHRVALAIVVCGDAKSEAQGQRGEQAWE
jgi:hypothetical protein